uniref:transposase n=1 Tax=Pseudomonas knackmussii TaxID=65741 RepID=UPI001364656B|nr:transposase [Pseudomonas knackmussii]
MGYIRGEGRDQGSLFPVSLDEWVPEEHLVRVIEAYVARLDLQRLGFSKAQASKVGRPAYDPADLLKLYLYGYFQRVRSSRRLEAECQRNVEVMWLLGRLSPDFKTIADFRKDNGAAFQATCRAFVQFCRQVGLLGGQLVAIDGSKFQTCKDAGITAYVPPNRGVNNHGNGTALFDRSAFTYDAEHDRYQCPAGQWPLLKQARGTERLYAIAGDCRACPLKARCTNSQRRPLSRHSHESAFERMQQRLKARPEMMARRRAIVEHPFGNLKQWIFGNGRFLLRQLAGARTEIALAVQAYNLKRAIQVLGA